MAFLNKVGSCNMIGSLDIVANSISLIQPDGSLQVLSLGGTVPPVNNQHVQDLYKVLRRQR